MEKNIRRTFKGRRWPMPHARRSRHPLDFDKDLLLEVLGRARETLIAAQRGMKPKSGLSRSADALVSDIDEFALVLTGARDYFHLKAHGTYENHK